MNNPKPQRCGKNNNTCNPVLSYSTLTRKKSYISEIYGLFVLIFLSTSHQKTPPKFGHFSAFLPHLAMVRIAYKLQRESSNAKQVAGVIDAWLLLPKVRYRLKVYRNPLLNMKYSWWSLLLGRGTT